jgi:hypothetical protein
MNQEVDKTLNIYTIATIGNLDDGNPRLVADVYNETGYTIRFRTFTDGGNLYNPATITFMVYHLDPVGQKPVTLS